MKKNIIKASILAMLLSSTALADTSSMSTTTTGMGVLTNDYVTAGVNGTTGTFGSGGNTSPGLLFDSTGTGTFNTGYDYLTPGSPFDGFSVMVDGTNYTNNNNGNTAGIVGDGNGLTDGDGTLSWTGGVTSVFDITNTYSLGATTPYVDITSQITMGTAASDVYFGRFIDPDARAASGDSSSTDNVLGYGTIPDSNVAFSEALSSRYALGLYSTDSNVDAGITRWTTDANSYTHNLIDGESDNTNTGDNTIGLSWHWTSVSSGDILTASYAYIFGPSAFDAASDAIDGGAGGGADITTGTLTDVGSATDAAEGTATPTVTSTSAPSTSYGAWGAWAHDTDLPVLTQSQTTHDSSVAAGVQTIDRETTTIVTTPEERTRTTTTTVVDTYSDGSTVTRTTGTGTETETRNNAVSTVTDPGAFVGRMDQVAQMTDLNIPHQFSIGKGISGGRITHDMGNGYSAETDLLSLGGRVTTDELVTLGAGISRADTTLTGAGSEGSMQTTGISLEASKHIDSKNVTVTGTVNTANSDLSYTRTIGDFSAAGTTKANDTWGTLTVEKSTGNIRPWAGYTIGKRTTDGWAETGDIQAQLLATDTESSYNYATIGLNIEAGVLDLGISKSFDDADTTKIGVGVNRSINERLSIVADVNRTIAGDNTSTYISAGLTLKF